MIRIEVVYARPEKQWICALELEEGTTAEDATKAAEDSEPFIWIDDMNIVAYAVWGSQVAGSYVLQDGDRLELLRALPVAPVEIRRRKAATAKL